MRVGEPFPVDREAAWSALGARGPLSWGSLACAPSDARRMAQRVEALEAAPVTGVRPPLTTKCYWSTVTLLFPADENGCIRRRAFAL
jgi:hypothetical protein